jgi:hypothetical protein
VRACACVHVCDVSCHVVFARVSLCVVCCVLSAGNGGQELPMPEGLAWVPRAHVQIAAAHWQPLATGEVRSGGLRRTLRECAHLGDLNKRHSPVARDDYLQMSQSRRCQGLVLHVVGPARMHRPRRGPPRTCCRQSCWFVAAAALPTRSRCPSRRDWSAQPADSDCRRAGFDSGLTSVLQPG